MKDYYEIFEIASDAPQDAIKEQYRFLVHAWHPDKFQNPAQKLKAEDKIKEINAAYVILGDPAKRTEYDIQAGYSTSNLQQNYNQPTTQDGYEDDQRQKDKTAKHPEKVRWRKKRENIDGEEDIKSQRIGQLDQEILLVNEEISKISKDLPQLPPSIMAISFSLGSLFIFMIAMTQSIVSLFYIGGFSLIAGIYLFNERAKFYKKNYKPIFDEVEKRKQHLQLLVQERRYLLSVS
ncbi:MAG: DnaJ domain-containing protein [Anaerolineales bacterium]|nr:DnaJ domain-containing protein [Anaerolineales bacterium]